MPPLKLLAAPGCCRGSPTPTPQTDADRRSPIADCCRCPRFLPPPRMIRTRTRVLLPHGIPNGPNVLIWNVQTRYVSSRHPIARQAAAKYPAARSSATMPIPPGSFSNARMGHGLTTSKKRKSKNPMAAKIAS